MLNEGWAIASQIGLWGWIASAIIFIVKVFPARNAFNGRAASVWGGVVIVFYIVWIAGMFNA